MSLLFSPFSLKMLHFFDPLLLIALGLTKYIFSLFICPSVDVEVNGGRPAGSTNVASMRWRLGLNWFWYFSLQKKAVLHSPPRRPEERDVKCTLTWLDFSMGDSSGGWGQSEWPLAGISLAAKIRYKVFYLLDPRMILGIGYHFGTKEPRENWCCRCTLRYRLDATGHWA